MEKRLTNEHIEQLFAFTKKHLVEHYDVQIELVDHLANAIEAQWKENPDISFEDALQKEYKNFGIFGFSGLVEQKQSALQNHYWLIIKKEMITFFSVPKIIFSVALFYGLFRFFSNPTELGEQLWFVMEITLFIFTIFFWIYQYCSAKRKQNKWLIDSVAIYLYSIPCTHIAFFFISNRLELSVFEIILRTILVETYILFFIILFTKIIPLLKNEIAQTEKKFQTL